MKTFSLILALLMVCEPSFGWRSFWKGRRFDGNVGHPSDFHGKLGGEAHDDLWFNQKLDHFEPISDETWKQVCDLRGLINKFY